ncbi:MAG: hypothetical protein NTX79_02225 [Candidatus Micrarchaeota archaeon]|nr:hypothetical protein [Candidatus Micrarchaeota archaeon]
MEIMTSCCPNCNQDKDAAKIGMIKKSMKESALLEDSREFVLLAQENVRKMTGDSVSGASLARLDAARYQAACKLDKVNKRLLVLDSKLAVIRDDVKAVQSALRSAGEAGGEDTEASRHVKETPTDIHVIGNPNRGLVEIHDKDIRETSQSKTNKFAGAQFLLNKIARLQEKIYFIEREAIPLRDQRNALLATIREINNVESLLLIAMIAPNIKVGEYWDAEGKTVVYWMEDDGNIYTRGNPSMGMTSSLRLIQVNRSWENTPIDGKPLWVSAALRSDVDSLCGGYPGLYAFKVDGSMAPRLAVNTYEGTGWLLPAECPNTLVVLFAQVQKYQDGLINGM